MEMVPMDKVAKSTNYPAVLRLLARDVMEGSSYFSVGRWLQQLSLFDLEHFITLTDDLNDEPENGGIVEMFILLSQMLANAEGMEIEEDSLVERVNLLVVYLSCESLYRKGMVEFDRTCCTFAEDKSGRSIAWPKGTTRPVA